MPDLFDTTIEDKTAPLAEKLRPQKLGDVSGQDHLVGPKGQLTKMLGNKSIPSLILWGPAGCGKTTIARIIADQSGMVYEQLSAIFSGIADLRKVFDQARIRKRDGQSTLLFVDEIHRFNKAQLDAFLPVVEDGTITLIGATTENPSFELNTALLSRCQVFVLKRLDDNALDALIERANACFNQPLIFSDEALASLKAMADGDGRYLMNMLEQLDRNVQDTPQTIDTDLIVSIISQRPISYDKDRDEHYNLISALHKSVRGSDPDAALYWLCRMLEGGEDPNFIGRRLVRMAIEDICLADPQALNHSLAAWQTYERLGSPEGELALANAVIYLATAPKSNAAYTAYKAAAKSAQKNGSLMPPKNILNAPTSLMKDEGYSDGYIYEHDTPEGFSGQNFFPDEMSSQIFYTPKQRGFEREIQKRLLYWEKLRKEKRKTS